MNSSESEFTVGALVNRASRAIGSNVAEVGRALESVLALPGATRKSETLHPSVPGRAPGIADLPQIHIPPDEASVTISILDYSTDRHEQRDVPVKEFEDFLAQEQPPWATVRWINIAGLHPWVVERVRKAIDLHPLAAEDTLHVPQRPGVDHYRDHTLIKLRMLTRTGDLLESEQVSLVLHGRTAITFQERPSDVWGPLRARITSPGTAIRAGTTGFLTYALIDAVVDHCFPILEAYGDHIEELEERISTARGTSVLHEVQRIRRELMAIRRVLWPTRDLIGQLVRHEDLDLSERTRTHLRDVQGHTYALTDIIESQREHCAALTDLHMSVMSGRMNEVMKVLTLIATLFIPITFLAGVYGMNFKSIPEMDWQWSYPLFWLICLVTVGTLLAYFRRKRWL